MEKMHTPSHTVTNEVLCHPFFSRPHSLTHSLSHTRPCSSGFSTQALGRIWSFDSPQPPMSVRLAFATLKRLSARRLEPPLLTRPSSKSPLPLRSQFSPMCSSSNAIPQYSMHFFLKAFHSNVRIRTRGPAKDMSSTAQRKRVGRSWRLRSVTSQ